MMRSRMRRPFGSAAPRQSVTGSGSQPLLLSCSHPVRSLLSCNPVPFLAPPRYLSDICYYNRNHGDVNGLPVSGRDGRVSGRIRKLNGDEKNIKIILIFATFQAARSFYVCKALKIKENVKRIRKKCSIRGYLL